MSTRALFPVPTWQMKSCWACRRQRVVSCANEAIASSVQAVLTSKKFRVYTNTDIVGTELGGSLKNVIAIAAGVSDGLHLGANSKAALLTRGLAEMTRLSVALGGQSITLAGLAGMGDLFATSAADHVSKLQAGRGSCKRVHSQRSASRTGGGCRGVSTTFAVCELAKRLNLDLPIASAVESMLDGKTTPEGAIMTLMSRPPVSEARLPNEKPGPPAGQSVNNVAGG